MKRDAYLRALELDKLISARKARLSQIREITSYMACQEAIRVDVNTVLGKWDQEKAEMVDGEIITSKVTWPTDIKKIKDGIQFAFEEEVTSLKSGLLKLEAEKNDLFED